MSTGISRETLIGSGAALAAVAAAFHLGQPDAMSTMPSLPSWLIGGGGIITAILGWLKDGGGGNASDLIAAVKAALADGKVTAEEAMQIVKLLGGGGLIPVPGPTPTPGPNPAPVPGPVPADDLARFQRMVQEFLQLAALKKLFEEKGWPKAIDMTITWNDGTSNTLNLDTLPKPKPVTQ